MDTTILTESQLAVREAVGDLCKNFPNSYWRERDRTATYPFDFHKALADGGWIGIALPEKNGGSGLGISEASVMLQTITESGAGEYLQPAAVSRGIKARSLTTRFPRCSVHTCQHLCNATACHLWI